VAIYQDTYYAQGFVLQDKTGAPINITSFVWTAAFRVNASDADPPLLTLSTGNGGIITTDGPNGKLQVAMTAVQTKTLPLGTIHADFMRTDQVGVSPQRYFGATFKVRQPVTRL
jgi:hypothetical protein